VLRLTNFGRNRQVEMAFLSVVSVKRWAAVLALLALAAGSAAHAATITVTTTADPGGVSDCSLRSAMSAAIAQMPMAGCSAGSGDDSIVFKSGVTGTISLIGILPGLTGGTLTITGPGGTPGITIDGSKVETVFRVSSRATLKLSKLTIVNASDSAVVNVGASLTVVQCTLSHNRAETTGGGAIFASAGSTTVTASTFSSNSSSTIVELSGGGAIFLSSPHGTPNTLSVSGSTFDQNSSASDGGAILTLDSAVTIVNSTFARNSADTGGGAIWDSGSPVSITNSTFSKNTTSSGKGGGAIDNVQEEMSLKGTILVGKAAGGNCFGVITDAGYNISDDDSCGFSGTSRNNTDPKLNPTGLADNGGPTGTIALMVGSPAVDAIPIASCTDQASPPNALKVDQRGVSRPDPEDIANPACDIGAYELVECTGAFPSIPTIFPPNHKFVSESIMGVTGVTITGIFQDEPVRGKCPDATGVGSDMAQVRAERDDRRGGRTYHIQFSATDTTISGACLGEVKVCVPHDRKHITCMDQGALFDSTLCGPRAR